jgi:hypothetical protein
VMADFRCIDSYKAEAPAVTQLDCVSIEDVCHLYTFIDPGRLAVLRLNVLRAGWLQPASQQQEAQSKRAPDPGALLV